MNSSDNPVAGTEKALTNSDADVVLASEAGLPFQPPPSKDSEIDPFAEWLSLMEVVQMLCPAWPVRDRPLQGRHWRL